MMILTAVPNISINFGKSDQRELDQVSLSELRAYHAEGHFPPGSMGPKVEACIKFLEGGGKRAIIGHLNEVSAALNAEAGTNIVVDDR